MTIEKELSSLLEVIEETSGLVWASEGTAIVHDPDIGVYRGHVADCVEEDDAKAIVQAVEFIRTHGPALLSSLADQRRLREARTLEVFDCPQAPGTADFDFGDLSHVCAGLSPGTRVAIVPIDPECDHQWVSARNSHVTSGELCLKCHAIRAEGIDPEGGHVV